MSAVDPQTCSDEQIQRRMSRFVKLEPMYMAAMVDNERNYWVPKRNVPVPKQEVLRDRAA